MDPTSCLANTLKKGTVVAPMIHNDEIAMVVIAVIICFRINNKLHICVKIHKYYINIGL